MSYEFSPDSIAAAFDETVPWELVTEDEMAAAVSKPVKRVTDLFYAQGESMFAVDGPAAVAQGWSCFPQEIEGRRPGRVLGETIRFSKDHDLEHALPTAEALSLWVPHCATLNTACVFGAASGHTFALDIDILDAEMAEEVADMADRILGPSPFRRQGREPKIALLYRHGPEASDRVASTSKRFLTVDESGAPITGEHGLEILGAGKLITFFGRHHTTGRYFKWLESSPMRFGPELAPLVTPAQVAEFMAAVHSVFPFANGATRAATFGSADVPVDGEGRETEGREDTLSRLVFRHVNAARATLLGVAAMPGVVEAMRADITSQVIKAFAARCALDGRWASDKIGYEAGSRVERTVAKLLDGRLVERPAALVTRVPGDIEVVVHEHPLPPPARLTNKPSIIVEAGDMERIVDAAEAALIASERGIYQRGGEIVGVAKAKVRSWDESDIEVLRIQARDEHALAEDLGAAAQWLRFDGRKKQNVAIDPPMPVVKTLQGRAGRFKLPNLAGFLSAPTLRSDGSIVQNEGYDTRLECLLDTRGVTYPRVPENPTRDDAVQALGVLRGIVSTFPFVTPEDEAVMLAGMLTAVVRRSIPFAPLVAFTAPLPASGKSKLVDMLSILSQGHRAGVLTQGRTEEENEKRIAAALIAGDPMICLDNCTLPVSGDLMAQLMTQTTLKPRVLGQSKVTEVSAAVLVTANGNNLLVEADMVRRTLLCTLDPKVERPQEREFPFDPVDVMLADRPRYVVAALTVLRAHHLAGRPACGTAPLGNFMVWSKWIRDSLLWLGCADPVRTQDKQRQQDPALEELTAILIQWNQVLGDKPVLVREIVTAATDLKPGLNGQSSPRNPDFLEAINGVALVGSTVSAKRLGKWIGRNQDRRTGGLHIVRSGDSNGSAMWRLVRE